MLILLLQGYPKVEWLDPGIALPDGECVLATRLIGPVERSALPRMGSAADHSEPIVRTIDILLGGV